jgi:AcrR family transcriptional regulator
MKPSRSTSINIADISRRAGVTRSAFYFYFENKAAAVAALMEQMYDDAFVATEPLTGDGPTLQRRIRAATDALFDTWERHSDLFQACRRSRR